MSAHSENHTKIKTIVMECIVWACLAFLASCFLLLLLGHYRQACDYNRTLADHVFAPFVAASDYLRDKEYVSRDSWSPLLICWATPWMIVGGVFGVLRGKFAGPSAMANNSGCLVISAFVVLSALIGSLLVFML